MRSMMTWNGCGVLYGRGFLNYQITAEKEFTQQKKVHDLVIEEGPVYRVAEISRGTRVR
jgi:hypothetical protein